MSRKPGKFFVGNEFRTNRLSKQESSIRAEVHAPGVDIKVYTNIHYPNAFSKKVFKENSNVTHVIFKNSDTGHEQIIKND